MHPILGCIFYVYVLDYSQSTIFYMIQKVDGIYQIIADKQENKSNSIDQKVTIDWSMFDKIVCIHFLPYKERLEPIKKELARVGILDLPQFEFYYTIDNELYYYVLDGIPDGNIDRKRVDRKNIKYTIDSFALLKKLQFFQYKKVLIIEDDVVFHKDLKFIQSVIASTPHNFDIMNYDPIKLNDSLSKSIKVNNYISKIENSMLVNTSCIALSKKAISWMIDKQLGILEPFDICTWSDDDYIKTFCTTEQNNICVQNLLTYGNRQGTRSFTEKYNQIDSQNYNFTQLIVSLTSYPHRFSRYDFIDCLKSLVQQKTSISYKIVLNLFKDDVCKLPKNLIDFIKDNNIEVIVCDKDIKQHKKYFYVMQKYRDLPVITVDDDMIYRDNLVEDLYKTYLENQDAIVCGRCDRIAIDENGKTLSYDYWKQMIDISNCKDDDLFGVGCGGILYPSSFCKAIDNRLLSVIPIIKSDDCLLYMIAKILGLKHMTVNTSSKFTKYGGGGFLVKQPLPTYNDNAAMWKVNQNANYKDQCISYFGKCQTIDQLIDISKKTSCRHHSVAIVAIARLENLYINEWIEYHVKLGFDRIYLYDNACGNEDHIDKVLTVQNSKFVTVIPAYDKKFYQMKAYEDAYSKYGQQHEYMLFIDIDEFFTLMQHNSISEYVEFLNSRCPNFQDARINWELYDDNNAIERDLSVPVHKFFTQLVSTREGIKKNIMAKCLLKTGLNDIYFPSEHYALSNTCNLITCNSIGEAVQSDTAIVSTKRNVSVAKIRHYMTKTLSEYMNQKLRRDDASGYIVRNVENRFFIFCKRTDKKMEYYNRRRK